MLFLGLGTGLGAAMIVDGMLQPMELAHLIYKNGKTYEDYLGLRGLERFGKKKWRRHVATIAKKIKTALKADYVVLGGGNSKKLKKLPPRRAARQQRVRVPRRLSHVAEITRPVSAVRIIPHGRQPGMKPIMLLPVGKQAGLRPVHLLGKIRIDPNVDDFYKHVVEQKEANKADATLKKGLKCIGNAGAYGPLVELNEQKESEDVRLDVYSGEHYHQQAIREREVPGPFYFPPLASLITAGGRLLLALAEKCVADAGGTYLFCDTDSLCVVADEKGGFSRGGARADLGYVEGADMREFAPVPCLSRDTVIKISERFAALNPYSFGGTILKVEDVNYIDGDPRKPFRDLYGYAISAKRYCLFEGKNVRKIVDSKAHGIGYLMNPIQRKRDKDEDQFADAFWQCVLQNEGISLKHEEPEWLDLPAMMRIPVSSPAVLGRLKDFCKPYDFVLAPVVRDGDFNLDEEANKPILVTRFAKNSEEWSTATYFNVRTGKPCRITTGEPTSKGTIPVRSYRSVLNAYVNNAESKFDGPDGKQCCSWTRGILQRMHIVAGEHRYCGKEFKRKLEQGPVDHEIEFKCKVYENGRVVAGPETLRQLASFSERQISKGTGVHRDTIRLIRHGKGVKRSTYERVMNFLRQKTSSACAVVRPRI